MAKHELTGDHYRIGKKFNVAYFLRKSEEFHEIYHA